MNDSPPRHIYTVDLEEWFHGLTSTNGMVERWPEFESRVVYATERLLGILRSHGVRATFFVLGHVADHHPSLIERVLADGHEIGVHGYFHRFVYKMTRDEFCAELDRSIEAVMRVTGVAPIGHRAPYFSVNATTPWAFECMVSRGLRYDSSVFPTRNPLYGYPGAPRFPHFVEGVKVEGTELAEFPASTVKVAGTTLPVAGGFYVRALPYPAIRWALRQLERAEQPAVLYIHPWEIDTGQRYPHVTARERLTHYHGRRGLERKLHRLFSDFRFGTMGGYYARWQSSPSIAVARHEPATVAQRPLESK